MATFISFFTLFSHHTICKMKPLDAIQHNRISLPDSQSKYDIGYDDLLAFLKGELPMEREREIDQLLEKDDLLFYALEGLEALYEKYKDDTLEIIEEMEEHPFDELIEKCNRKKIVSKSRMILQENQNQNWNLEPDFIAKVTKVKVAEAGTYSFCKISKNQKTFSQYANMAYLNQVPMQNSKMTNSASKFVMKIIDQLLPKGCFIAIPYSEAGTKERANL